MNKNFLKLMAILLFAVGAGSTVQAQAQYQKIGDNPFTIEGSAALEIATGADTSVPSRGFLPPRMTSTQRAAINLAAKGLMVYDTDKKAFMVQVGEPSALGTWKPAATATLITYKTVADDYTLTADDYTVLGNAATKAITLTLPAASGAQGKIYIVGKNDTTTANLVTFSAQLKFSKSTAVSAINYAKTFRIQSDGTNWNIID